MTDFDFTREMVYGKKHMNKINFNTEKYDLYNEVTQLFGFPLNEAHENVDLGCKNISKS